jgi:uncharacterized protein
MRIFYLHGFASGPQSSKAQFFRGYFPTLEIPDLTEGDFEHSTLTQQLRYLDSLVGSEPSALIGSSMGGYLAALFAARHPERVTKLVLMAPAFGLARRWTAMLGETVMQEWQQRGWRSVYHYGEKRDARVGYDLVADGFQYEDFPNVREPTLIFHGRRDDAVDYRLSEEFARSRPNVELVLLDSDHQLLDMLDLMGERARESLAVSVNRDVRRQ